MAHEWITQKGFDRASCASPEMSLFTRTFTGALVAHERMSCVRIGWGRLPSLNLTRTMPVLIAARHLARPEPPPDAHRRSTGRTLRTERTFTPPLLLAFLASPPITSWLIQIPPAAQKTAAQSYKSSSRQKLRRTNHRKKCNPDEHPPSRRRRTARIARHPIHRLRQFHRCRSNNIKSNAIASHGSGRKRRGRARSRE